MTKIPEGQGFFEFSGFLDQKVNNKTLGWGWNHCFGSIAQLASWKTAKCKWPGFESQGQQIWQELICENFRKLMKLDLEGLGKNFRKFKKIVGN